MATWAIDRPPMVNLTSLFSFQKHIAIIVIKNIKINIIVIFINFMLIFVIMLIIDLNWWFPKSPLTRMSGQSPSQSSSPTVKFGCFFVRDCIAFPPHWGTFLKEECFPNPGFLQKKGGSDPCQDILVNLTFKFIVPLKVMICPQKWWLQMLCN